MTLYLSPQELRRLTEEAPPFPIFLRETADADEGLPEAIHVIAGKNRDQIQSLSTRWRCAPEGRCQSAELVFQETSRNHVKKKASLYVLGSFLTLSAQL